MRRQEKKVLLDLIRSFRETHKELNDYIVKKDKSAIQYILSVCQEAAVKIGTCIEQSEGEGTVAVQQLEEYCKAVYGIFQKLNEEIAVDPVQEITSLQRTIDFVEDYVRNHISARSEIVFFPYKASMWDSFESVWKAATADPYVDAYVVPIPYFDRNSDGTAGEMHYEGELFPDDVPVISYREYDLKKRHPDVAYIHNPYDEFNTVTTVDPRFYSYELKKYVDILVYIPYCVNPGVMGEGGASLSVYGHADYILAQAPLFRSLFDPSVPDEKLLFMGSPKFDSVIERCKSSCPMPELWEECARGRKIYFYNTSISGMLVNTRAFINKMNYVFETFRKHPDVCLLWRPHPLLDATFKSMRPAFYQSFLELKERFISEKTGIYDDTPDVTGTISHSYAYIGEIGSAVTAQFGIVGKPIFILDDYVETLPEEENIKKGISYFLFSDHKNSLKYLITDGNKLFIDIEDNYKYKYVTALTDYIAEGWYTYAVEINGCIYCCGNYAQDIVVVKDNRIVKRIEFKNKISRSKAFYAFHTYGECIYLIPELYGSIVKYDTVLDKVTYYDGYKEDFSKNIFGQHLLGGTCIYKNYLLMASPTNHDILAFDLLLDKFLFITIEEASDDEICGCNVLVPDESDGAVWILPYNGKEIRRWYPESGKVQVYDNIPAAFSCAEFQNGKITELLPFSSAAVSRRYMVMSPLWGNRFLKLDKASGEISVWEPGLKLPDKPLSCYYHNSNRAIFIAPIGEENVQDAVWLLFSYNDRTLYKVNIDTDEITEMPIEFDIGELKQHACGFGRYTHELKYCMVENVFNSLSDFLEDNTIGTKFDKKSEIMAFNEIVANNDGTCGQKVHEFIMEKLEFKTKR
ncbi:hypothetical protein UYO_2806 [Lachnospiraceae bacterium JC7]|nr:hypothetical protein UYO_2806 [Lachnospiraceae bacterium JC7]